MMSNINCTVETGKLFSLPAKEGSKFEKKHDALSILTVNEGGNFSGTIVGNKQQLVFEVRQPSSFSIDGKKIKLDLPEGADQARYIISYAMTSNGGFELKTKMDYQDTDKQCIRIKFDPIFLAKNDTKAHLNSTNLAEKIIKRDLNNSVSGNGTPDALRYLEYKSKKCTIDTFSNSQFKTNLSSQDKPIIENRGSLTTQSYSLNSSVTALPSVESAINLDLTFNANSDSVADKIDDLKSRISAGIGSSRDWDNVVDGAAIIALLHGKPTYTKNINTYATKLIKPQYSDILNKAGLNPLTLKKDIQILAQLPVLSEADNPVKVMRSGKFTKEQELQYLSAIPEKTAAMLKNKLGHLPKSSEYADAILGKGSLGTAGFLLRSIAAMDQPRSFRIGNRDCDAEGKFNPDALIRVLSNDARKKGYDQKVIDAFIEIYSREIRLMARPHNASLKPN